MAAISVQGISKAYRIGRKTDASDSLVGACTQVLTSPLRNLRELRKLNTDNTKDDDGIFWALKDISFEVGEGEAIGILGHNGAGKSTLLKVLSKITTPTHGHAKIRGRISSLLEVGTGFHPDLTGRENVYMNAAILGMSKREIDRKFDQIVDFSGVEKFLDTPTKRYSSGMQVRLAFAVAAHLDPEILIVDEVLAVGDSDFQRKCTDRMKDISSDGRTVLFVSHNMDAIQKMCKRCVCLEGGHVKAIGDTTSMVKEYLKRTDNRARELVPEKLRQGTGKYRIDNIEVVTSETASRYVQIKPNEELICKLSISPRKNVDASLTSAVLLLYDSSGLCVYACDSRNVGIEFSSPDKETEVVFRILSPWLKPGSYSATAILTSKGVVDLVEKALHIDVLPTHPYQFAAPNWITNEGKVYANFKVQVSS